MIYKFFILQLLFLLAGENIYAQNTQDLELSLPTAKVPGNLYHKLNYLDSRPDNTCLGFVQTGLFNKKAKVIPKTSLSVQLTGVFNAFADTSGKQAELLFQLRQCSFAEITGAIREKGCFYLRAGLYSAKNGQFQEINSIDTVIVCTSSIDVTNSLLRIGKETITAFIADNLSREPTGQFYTYHTILNIDSVEKRKIKLYNTNTYADGLYATYKSFMNQTPDNQIVVEGNYVNAGAVKTISENGKLQKVKAQKIYAIVYKGQPYISSRNTYYRLEKENDDFFFTGKVQAAANTGEAVAAGIMFGAIGSLIVSNDEATFEMKIDHVNGGFIRLKEIPDPTMPE